LKTKKTFLTTNLFENTIRTKFILNIYINYFENIINYICENNNKKNKKLQKEHLKFVEEIDVNFLNFINKFDFYKSKIHKHLDI